MIKQAPKYKPPQDIKIEMPDYGTSVDKPKTPSKIIRGTRAQRSGRRTNGLV